MKKKTALIFGAGPAGLTAAYELLDKTDIKPIIYEADEQVGGLSKTLNHKGNRLDIGPHRFFSKSKRIMDWWLNILPLQGGPALDDILLDRKLPFPYPPNSPDPQDSDDVLLYRHRITRIFFMGKFFDYPITLNWITLKNLGLSKLIRIAVSYCGIRLKPIRNEKSLEDFFINRFGKELYLTFFKDYTEKVWGISCKDIKPDWGRQRVKGLSIFKTLLHALKLLLKGPSVDQKNIETSLIGHFFYPKYGSGQMWERVADHICDQGGEIHLNHQVKGVESEGGRIQRIKIKNEKTGQILSREGDFFFSSMPVQDLVLAFDQTIPSQVREIGEGLMYRDIVLVGILLRELKIKNEGKINSLNNIIPDHWLYIQEKTVKLGRLGIINNWSPYMVKDRNTVWLGLEYFGNIGDELWQKPDKEIAENAMKELTDIGLIEKEDVYDNFVWRIEKGYPAYFGSYAQFDILIDFFDQFKNLYLIGRNGMHKYNNMDHSMLSAIKSVENISNGIQSKAAVWAVNTEEDYHEG